MLAIFLIKLIKLYGYILYVGEFVIVYKSSIGYIRSVDA